MTVRMKRVKNDQGSATSATGSGAASAANARERDGEFKEPEPPTNKVLKSSGFAVYKNNSKPPSKNLSIMSFLTQKKTAAMDSQAHAPSSS